MRKAFWPTDTDVFQELEKDPVLRRKFEESCADVLSATKGGTGLGHGEMEDEERMREEEVRTLLHTREGDLAKQEKKWKAEREAEVSSQKWRGSMEVQSPKTARVSVEMPAAKAGKKSMGQRRRSEMDVEMVVLEETETGR